MLHCQGFIKEQAGLGTLFQGPHSISCYALLH
jgi:hypothetical protein